MKTRKSILMAMAALSLALTAPLYVPFDAGAKKVTTKVKAPKPSKDDYEFSKFHTYPHHKSDFEDVVEDLTFMAYDKRTSSAKETFFVDNGSSVPLQAIEIEISYYSSSGKLLHKRTVEIEQEFPPCETRKVDIASWDTQKSFHYVNSLPSSKGSTPYSVRFKVLSFVKLLR